MGLRISIRVQKRSRRARSPLIEAGSHGGNVDSEPTFSSKCIFDLLPFQFYRLLQCKNVFFATLIAGTSTIACARQWNTDAACRNLTFRVLGTQRSALFSLSCTRSQNIAISAQKFNDIIINYQSPCVCSVQTSH